MKYNQYKTFDLTQKRPNVLLLGNGLTRSTSVSWVELIRSIRRYDAITSPYEIKNSDGTVKSFNIPNTILTLATSITNDSERGSKYSDLLNRSSYPPNSKLNQLLSIPFDAVLTTNYTYELESEFLATYPGARKDKKREYVCLTKKVGDPRFLLHTFNRISDGPDIWHIHGEMRRPSSVVLTHDEYAKHVKAVTQYCVDRGREYATKFQELKFLSWVDYLLFGNVYVIGLSMDFSEFDLWWLLGKRQREKLAKGSFFFYEGETESNKLKQLALHDSGADIVTFDIKTEKDADYDLFYNTAIEEITDKLNQSEIPNSETIEAEDSEMKIDEEAWENVFMSASENDN